MTECNQEAKLSPLKATCGLRLVRRQCLAAFQAQQSFSVTWEDSQSGHMVVA